MNDRCTPQWFWAVVERFGGRTSSLKVLPFTLALIFGFVLLPVISAGADQAALPADVPNIFDPGVRARFEPVMLTNLRNNPEFPLILLVNTTGEQPEALILGLDARNGKDTWSLASDPIIVIVALFGEKIQELYVDLGFAQQGTASGTYAAVEEIDSTTLPDLLDAVPEPAARTYI